MCAEIDHFPVDRPIRASLSLVSIFEQSAPHRNKRVLLLSVQLSGWPIFNGMPSTLAFISSPSGLCIFCVYSVPSSAEL
jgi:hypothetical protein